MREHPALRGTIEQLNTMFPDKGALGRQEIAKFYGVHVTTVDRWVREGIFNLNTSTRKVSKYDFATQVCKRKE